MAFKQRKDAGSSALNKVTTGYQADPKEFQYNKLEVGEGVVVRILSLHEDDTVSLPIRRAHTTNAKNKDKDPILSRVADPGVDYADEILDDTGTPLSECVEQTVLWVPVWALYTVDKNGVVKEEIEELMYVKLLPGLQKELKKLEENVKEGFEFEVIPPYDIRIEVVKDDSIQNYEMYPVTKLVTPGPTKGKFSREDCPRYGVEDLGEALGKDVMKVLDDEFDSLLEHMQKLADEEADPVNVRKRFFYKGKGPNEGAETESRGGGMRRGVASRAKADETEDEEESGDGAEEGSEEESTPSRYSGGVGKRFGKKR